MTAFAHALRISLAARCKLYIAHIAESVNKDEWHAFPHVRQTLARWGLLDAEASTADIAAKLGVEIAKVEIAGHDPARGLSRFLTNHPAELMVLSTHGRQGLPRWVRPSVAESMSRRTLMQSLFIPEHCAGFVERQTGTLKIARVLVPVDHQPAPIAAIRAIQHFCQMIGAAPQFNLLHIGSQAPVATVSTPTHRTPVAVPIEVRGGNVVDGILQAAAEIKADLIGMATAGHHGLLDAIRGSTTERVLRDAPCPLLAVPVEDCPPN